MKNSDLTVRGIHKSFGGFQALRDIHLDIPKGQFTCLLGPSGCGKTTLLRIIAGLERPDAGKIELSGRDITALPPAKRNFGIVFQSYALFPNLTAAQNIAYGLKGKLPRKQIEEKVREALELVDLHRIEERYPAQLSGGQQQRVALARAIVMSPELLLLDEPLSALDAKVRIKLRQELRALQERLGITAVMVTHDQEEALTLADRIVVMNNAQVMQSGSPQEVYERPNCPFVADFIGAINFLPGSQVAGYPQPEALLAVRPEHIRVVSSGRGAAEHDVPVIAGLIRHVEFRGPYYRIELQLLNDREEPVDQAMTIDVSVQASQSMELVKHRKMMLTLPQERLLAFDREAAVLQ
ncbi:ATP-binding cassette domain-containing protein [Paenibacillus doosanensis]|uniref:Sulfate/thiosulfate import ATP-binding protein CysA n=1 Tax=Paenibacillus konkukensis TaxID=2020716 RepID=A0ABY4RSV4_9BACL|nr:MULTISPECIES: ATP-binding cassette domain-containing protein [Paenibacillus]MCS7460960.1 ATP-binding cassette domain-containing protein [Paenibacillus doosanensis]UQZ85629.1 Sulfate/thiosulfate import ATP-binding protein CysA [Paenibacillus konkukensis]